MISLKYIVHSRTIVLNVYTNSTSAWIEVEAPNNISNHCIFSLPGTNSKGKQNKTPASFKNVLHKTISYFYQISILEYMSF